MRRSMKFHPGLVLVIFLFFQDLLALKLNAEPSREWSSVESRRRQVLAFPASSTEGGKDGVPSTWAADYVPSVPKLVRRGSGPPWSEEDDARLVELKGQGFTYKELTAHFPIRSEKALKNRYQKLTRDPSAPKRAPGDAWTGQEIKRLRALVKAGLPWKEIAEYFPNRTQSAVHSRYKALLDGRPTPKAPRRPFTAEEDELLIKLKGEGMSFKKMSSSFTGRSGSTLAARYKGLSRLGDLDEIQSRKRWTVEEDQRLMKALEQGMTAKEISEHLNRPPKGVSHRIALLKDKGLIPRRQ